MSDWWDFSQTNSDGSPALPCGCWAIIAGALALWAIIYSIWLPQTDRTVTAKVTNEWVKCVDHEDCKNLVGTDHGVFEDHDSLLYWKWNSSDFYNNAHVGQTCTFHVVGWRVPISSTYPNIVKMENCH